MKNRPLVLLLCVSLCLSLAACSDKKKKRSSATPPATYTVGGTVSGLSGTLVLQNNGGDSLTRPPAAVLISPRR